ncbi:hypothetical protein [Alistipes indistinctus]|jgi:hypothetical protein|uniref:hypothetical protein n=1 Tax=Alistipes indistinctus TaxID=626932 RepID=UPI002052E800|nr:MAG TPA: hypothetical protein [Caudoviricetes sp.]
MKKIIDYFRQKRDARFLKRLQRALASGADFRINGGLSVTGDVKAFDGVKTTEWNHTAWIDGNFNPATKN